ncbi:MAG: CDP-alcohol phosphatidyltransferase family protein [Anaerolineales bacterium]|jgi:phosphatidylglycerophosphate synthase
MWNTKPNTRRLADLLTLSRVALSLAIIFLGTQTHEETLPKVVILVLLSWFTDLIDGPLARHDLYHPTTIIGQHDAEADLTTSIGVTIYLVLAGYVPAAGALVFLLFLTRVWFWHSHQLAWPLYALPYAFLLVFAFQEITAYGRLMGAYILTMLVVSWPRLQHEFLPEFFEAVQSVRQRKE